MSNAYRSVLESGGVTPTGDAVAADVLTGKTFSNANAVGIAGTMTNNGAVSQTLLPGQSYTIPEGYHNGNGVVSASAPSFANIFPLTISTSFSTSAQMDNAGSISGDGWIVPVTGISHINISGDSEFTVKGDDNTSITIGSNIDVTSFDYLKINLNIGWLNNSISKSLTISVVD